MSAWPAALFEQWYALARSDRLGRAPLAATVLDLPLVLARDAHGRAFALQDRCPHRHAPLSAGCMAGGLLQCPYHGWRMDRDGHVRAIPGLPAGAPLPTLAVPAFPVIEHDGIVWLRPAAHGPAHLPAALAAQDPRARRFLWQTTWPAPVLDAMENFLDPLHTHFLHPGLVRRGDARQPRVATLQASEDGFRVDYTGSQDQSGWLFRLFESPRTAERARVVWPGTARLEYRYASGAEVDISLHFTPVDATSTRVTATLHVRGRWAPRWAVHALVWPLLRRVNQQDHAMLDLQAWNRRRFPPAGVARTALDLVRGPLEDWWQHGRVPAPGTHIQVAMEL